MVSFVVSFLSSNFTPKKKVNSKHQTVAASVVPVLLQMCEQVITSFLKDCKENTSVPDYKLAEVILVMKELLNLNLHPGLPLFSS